MPGGASEIDESAGGEHDDVSAAGHGVSVDLRFNILLAGAVLL